MDLEAAWAQCGSFGLKLGSDGIITDATDSVRTLFDAPRADVIGTKFESWTVYVPGLAIRSRRGVVTRVSMKVVMHDDHTQTRWFESVEEKYHIQAQSDRYADDLKQLEYAVSHDLMEPIRMIGGYLSMYIDEYQTSGTDNLDYLMKAQGAVKTTRGFLTDFVKYLRLDTYHRGHATLRWVDLNEIVHDVLQSLHLLVQEADAEVVYGNLPTIQADGRMFYQVFSNLIMNALKYRDPAKPCRVVITSEKTAEGYVIKVSDNGRGIHPGKTERIFAPFVRGHKDVPGSGIGLAIVKRCLEYHSARIRAVHQASGGSVFVIDIPSFRVAQETTLLAS